MRTALGDDSRVTFTRFLPDESLAVHGQHHIAVVPSLASEGTSLSLAEGTGTGCAVIASGVGGMTNMVIDGYNGRLVEPQAEALAVVLRELIIDRPLRQRLAARARDRPRSVSLERWRARWSRVLDEIERCPLNAPPSRSTTT